MYGRHRVIKVFIGFDPKQPVAYNVCQYSVVANASGPVCIIPLILSQLPMKRRGLTEFTYSRFLVPHLSDFEGTSVFIDPDIIVTGDVYELLEYNDNPVYVMQDQEEFEWASVMVFNNSLCDNLTPEFIDDEYHGLFNFDWVRGDIGELPQEWNHLCFYKEPIEAKLYHYTVGIPVWDETREISPETPIWREYFDKSVSTVSWKSLMGNSVHAARMDKNIVVPNMVKVFFGRFIKNGIISIVSPQDVTMDDRGNGLFAGFEDPDTGDETHANIYYSEEDAAAVTKKIAEDHEADSWDVQHFEIIDPEHATESMV